MSMTALAGPLGAGIVRTLGSTLSVDFIGEAYLAAARHQGQHVIYAFWHEGLVVATYAFRDQGIRVLVSQHRDGEYIARAIERMGYSTVRGSTTRGGTKALFRMVSGGTQGVDLGITVDGPRGPRLKVQAGALYIARRSGLPIVPFAVACSHKKTLSSWDRFMIPWPFSRAVVAIGPCLSIAPDCSREEMENHRLTLENRLQEVRNQAEDATAKR
jgi:lysophospholipid acyltransferase (LPLAT)-like uncharacterized protein